MKQLHISSSAYRVLLILAGVPFLLGICLVADGFGNESPLPVAPDWTFQPEPGHTSIVDAGITAGDVNGDGYSDVVVGAGMYSNDQDDEGRAYLFLGSASGLDPIPDWFAEGNQVDARFGTSISGVGDVNGDGFDDVVVGAYGFTNDQTEEGRAYLYLGSSSGLENSTSWIVEGDLTGASLGFNINYAGDVNGDGFSDFTVGAPCFSCDSPEVGSVYLYLGSSSGPSATPDWTLLGDPGLYGFGRSVGTAGDVNADGYSDLLVGYQNYTNGETNEGVAYLFPGSASGLSTVSDWTMEGNSPQSNFGKSVATAGDVNGDGFSDVAIGAPYLSSGTGGQVFVYTGSASGLGSTEAWTYLETQLHANYGYSVGTAGDVNGDGFSDLIVGERYWDDGPPVDAGRSLLYLGSASGLGSTDVWEVTEVDAFAELGAHVATAGDVNGDGFSEIIVCSPYYTGGGPLTGRALLFHGSGLGAQADPGWTAIGYNDWESLGSTLDVAGDVNGDGFSDILVGSDAYDNEMHGGGRVELYLGSEGGLPSIPGWTYLAIGGGFGISSAHVRLAGVGDVNGDGFSDLVLGAPGYGNGQLSEGRVMLFYGSPDGYSSTPVWYFESNLEEVDLGAAVSRAGDVNGDGFADFLAGAPKVDITPNIHQVGRAYLFYGSPSGPGSYPAWTVTGDQRISDFSANLRSAGDVNADGFGDILVGAAYYDNDQNTEGRVYLYLGSVNGPGSAHDWMAEGNQDSAGFGSSFDGVGDINGDGFSDVVLCARSFDNGEEDEGRAYLYMGSASGLGTAPDWQWESNLENAVFGSWVDTAGDVDGDGFSDVVIGASGYSNGETREGRALLFLGSSSGLSSAPAWFHEINSLGADFGDFVSSAGDVNGDGFGDFMVGALDYEEPSTSDLGLVHLFYGNGGAGLARIPRQAKDFTPGLIDILGKSDSNSSFRLKALGRTPAGRGNVALEWEVKPFGTPFDSTGIVRGSFHDTGLPVPGSYPPSSGAPPFGSAVELSELVTGLAPGTGYHWRLRIVSDNPLFPCTPWFSLPYNAASELDLGTGRLMEEKLPLNSQREDEAPINKVPGS